MLIDWEIGKEKERDFILLHDLTTCRKSHELSAKECGEIVEDLQRIMAGKRPPKKFDRVQRRDPAAGLALKERRFELLPVLPDPVRRPAGPIMGMLWSTSGEYWPEMRYEKDKSTFGLLLFSAARHSMFAIRRAVMEHTTGTYRLGVDQIQEAHSEAFIGYCTVKARLEAKGDDIESKSEGYVLSGIKNYFRHGMREGEKRAAALRNHFKNGTHVF